MLTKKSLVISSFVFSVVLASLILLQKNSFCYATDWCRTLWGNLNLVGYILFVFPFVFLFSLITYFLRESVFRAWANFAKWWVPLQILLVLITPESSGGYFVSLIDKQFVAIILSGVFAILSLIIIIWKSVTRN